MDMVGLVLRILAAVCSFEVRANAKEYHTGL